MRCPIDADLHKDVANLVEEAGDAAGEETIGSDLLLLKGMVLGLTDAPVLLQFLKSGLLVKVLRDAVEFDPFDEVFAEFHEGVPASDALDQSLILSRLLQCFDVRLERLW